jgi:hypothetical protein
MENEDERPRYRSEAFSMSHSQAQTLQTVVVNITSDLGEYQMEVIPGDFSEEILVEGGRPYEEHVLRLGMALTSRGDHIVDVGANLGNHAIYWGLAGRKVTAFEPNPVVAQIIAEERPAERTHLRGGRSTGCGR